MHESMKFGPDELGNQRDRVYDFAPGDKVEIKPVETFEDVKASKVYQNASDAGKIELFHAWKVRDDARRAAMRESAQKNRLGSAAPMERQITMRGPAPETVPSLPPMPGTDQFRALGFEAAQAALDYWRAKGMDKKGVVKGGSVKRIGHKLDRPDVTERRSAPI